MDMLLVLAKLQVTTGTELSSYLLLLKEVEEGRSLKKEIPKFNLFHLWICYMNILSLIIIRKSKKFAYITVLTSYKISRVCLKREESTQQKG